MSKRILILLIIWLIWVRCDSVTTDNTKSRSDKTKIICTDKGCEGEYIGEEFIKGSDVAHQFSNEMSRVVGDKLKELYKNQKYVKVDFSKIMMSTEGMGTGKVVYKLTIPFEEVAGKCQAYTSFDHVGGWNHSPELSKRKSQLSNALLKGEKLEVSDLKTTKEGLQEYWIQWKNKEIQAECEMDNR